MEGSTQAGTSLPSGAHFSNKHKSQQSFDYNHNSTSEDGLTDEERTILLGSKTESKTNTLKFYNVMYEQAVRDNYVNQ